jgi:hypothetical protein
MKSSLSRFVSIRGLWATAFALLLSSSAAFAATKTLPANEQGNYKVTKVTGLINGKTVNITSDSTLQPIPIGPSGLSNVTASGLKTFIGSVNTDLISGNFTLTKSSSSLTAFSATVTGTLLFEPTGSNVQIPLTVTSASVKARLITGGLGITGAARGNAMIKGKKTAEILGFTITAKLP